MNETLNESVVVGEQTPIGTSETSDGLMAARYRMLEELPGLVFAVMTLAWIVVSFGRLSF